MPPRKPTESDDADAWSRAPRTTGDGAPDPLTGGGATDDTSAEMGAEMGAISPSSAGIVATPSPLERGTAMARELADAFRDHVQRALGRLPSVTAGLDDAETSLAFVDHYLRTVKSETRAPILALIAAEAGAYYGELVCRELGGTWIGDGKDPRRLRLLMRDQFLYFSPIDQAFEVLLGRDSPDDGDDDDDDASIITGLDVEFHAHRRARPRVHREPDATALAHADAQPDETPDDATWLAERLAELPPIAQTEYYSLTCRFETLKLVLELLATKHLSEGRTPREYQVSDYALALADADADG